MVMIAFFSSHAVTAFDIKLKVFDPVSSQTLADIPVVVVETAEKFFTDGNGTAVITLPEKGFYTFRIILPDGRVVQSRLQAEFRLSPRDRVPPQNLPRRLLL